MLVRQRDRHLPPPTPPAPKPTTRGRVMRRLPPFRVFSSRRAGRNRTASSTPGDEFVQIQQQSTHADPNRSLRRIDTFNVRGGKEYSFELRPVCQECLLLVVVTSQTLQFLWRRRAGQGQPERVPPPILNAAALLLGGSGGQH